MDRESSSEPAHLPLPSEIPRDRLPSRSLLTMRRRWPCRCESPCESRGGIEFRGSPPARRKGRRFGYVPGRPCSVCRESLRITKRRHGCPGTSLLELSPLREPVHVNDALRITDNAFPLF